LAPHTKKKKYKKYIYIWKKSKKKGAQNSAVLNGTVLLLPLDAQQGKNLCSPATLLLSLSLPKQKKINQQRPPLAKTLTRGLPPDEKTEGTSPPGNLRRLPSGCPATLLPLCHDWTGVVAPPFFPYQYQHRERSKGGFWEDYRKEIEEKTKRKRGTDERK
jgi:hypothetical protein